METHTEVMRQRVHRIGRGYRSEHRRPVSFTRITPPAPEPAPCTPEVHYDSQLPHAAWITGLSLLMLVAGVMLGLGLANHWG